MADPAPMVAYAAARGLARLTPAGGLEELWEPWFAEEAHRAWLPRAAAGLGALWEADPERAAEYLETVTTFAHDDAAEVARRRPWLVALADAHEDIVRVAPEAAAQMRRALVAAADPEALWRLADGLALQRLRTGEREDPALSGVVTVQKSSRTENATNGNKAPFPAAARSAIPGCVSRQ